MFNLNTNILAKVLAERLKRLLEKFVGPQQTRFVAVKLTTDNTCLCQLMHAFLEGKDEKGLIMLLLDLG